MVTIETAIGMLFARLCLAHSSIPTLQGVVQREMEEPIRFDVWGIVERKWLKLAITEIEKMNPELGKLEIHQLVNKSVVRGESIKLVGCLGWEEAQQFMKGCSWAKGMTLYQELYEPYQSSLFCARHNFHYGGCLGCHVCNGFYVRHLTP